MIPRTSESDYLTYQYITMPMQKDWFLSAIERKELYKEKRKTKPTKK